LTSGIKYDLHTTSFPEQPVSKNSLTNFRKAVYRYNQKYGCDLIKEEIEHQAKTFSKLLKIVGTSEYQELARKRAGIEGIPSVLRRRYKIDHLPVRGLIRGKVYLEFKISAINCKRLIKGLMNSPIPELSTLLCNHLFSLFSFQRTYRVKFAA
jgi:hypothetical protein